MQLLERLRSLFRLGDLLEEAYTRRDVDACVKLAREYRAAAESYAKVAGWMSEAASSSMIVDQRKQVVQLFGKLSEAELRALAYGKPINELALKPAENPISFACGADGAGESSETLPEA